MRSSFSIDTLLSLYHAFIHTHIKYCITTWGNTYYTHISRLVSIQKRALKIITFTPPRSSSKPLFLNLSVLPVVCTYKASLMILLHNVINRQVSVEAFPIYQFFNKNTTRFALSNNFLLPKVATNYGKQTACFSAISIWNTLNPDLKTLSLNRFRSSLKTYLLLLL